MFCSQCGKQLPENAKFCPECGQGLIVQHHTNQKSKETVTQSAGEFPELKKLKTGYIAIVAAFILGALICVGISGADGFFLGFVVMIICYLIGTYFVVTANKAAKTLPAKQAKEFNSFVEKWYKPTNGSSVIFIVALAIKWFAMM